MKLAEFDALSFDCYGTLIDWEAGLLAVLSPWAASRGVELGDEELLNAYARQETGAEAEYPQEPYPAILARSIRGLAGDLGTEATAEDIGSYKPSPRNFAALLAEVRRLGIGEGRLLHVAQSLFHDHVPAHEAGLPTAWINRRRGRPGPGATPPPSVTVTPDWEFPSLQALADAAAAESGSA